MSDKKEEDNEITFATRHGEPKAKSRNPTSNFRRLAVTQEVVLPTDKIETPYQGKLDALANGVFVHKALSNRFYKMWRETALDLSDFRVFAVNYYARVYATPTRISFALSTIRDWVSRIELLHNLSDELGHGVKDNVHVLVLFRWLESMNRALGGKEDFRTILNRSNPLPQTARFIDQTNALCLRGPQEAAGALLAQEWHGYTQIAYLCDGFGNYRDLYDFHDFHEVSEYFYVHLGRAEKEHRIQASVIAARHCQTDDEFARISASFETYMDLLDDFWEGIADSLAAAAPLNDQGALMRVLGNGRL